jgi:hypothetical protein
MTDKSKLLISIFALCVTAGILGWTIGVRMYYDGPPMYACTFDRIEGEFFTTEQQLTEYSRMIMVHIPEHTYMFPRTSLRSCQLIVEETSD